MQDYCDANPELVKSMLPEAMRINPTVLVEKNGRPMSIDPVSHMLQNRIIFYTGQVDEITAELTTTQLLFLEAENPGADINMNIASPGGMVYYGLGVIDTMNIISCDVATVGHSLQMSMGAMTLINGTPGKRYALPESRIMIHQPSGGNQGTASDMAASQIEINYLKAKLLVDIANKSGISIEHALYLCEKDNFFTPRRALELGSKGIIDGIVVGREKVVPVAEGDLEASPNKKPDLPASIILKRGDKRLDEQCDDLSDTIKLINNFNQDDSFERKLITRVDVEIEAMHKKNGTKE